MEGFLSLIFHKQCKLLNFSLAVIINYFYVHKFMHINLCFMWNTVDELEIDEQKKMNYLIHETPETGSCPL